jgi:phospholipid/cholesterol/gamma-HCH transport system permease protein
MFAIGIAWLEGLGYFVDFTVRAVGAIPGSLWKRPGAVIRQFERVAVASVPIVAAAGLSVGLVTWFQTHRLLAAHGAESTLPSFLAVAVIVEIGPMLAGLLVAGRMGAGLAAELGSMLLNEEVDAREALGTDPIASLVAPRMLACALAAPLLTILIDGSALLGGAAAEFTAGSMSPEVFWRRTLLFVRLSDALPATLKTSIFGLLVGLIACHTGLNADRSTEAVGRAATAGVVRSILAVFAANVVLVPVIQATVEILGMEYV